MSIRVLALAALLLALLACPGAALADDEDGGFLGIHEADLRIKNDAGTFDLLLSGVLDNELYLIQDESPGLLLGDPETLHPLRLPAQHRLHPCRHPEDLRGFPL